MPATLKPQFAVAMPLQVNGAGQTGYSLAIKNGPVGMPSSSAATSSPSATSS
jgi:hypothetical protein